MCGRRVGSHPEPGPRRRSFHCRPPSLPRQQGERRGTGRELIFDRALHPGASAESRWALAHPGAPQPHRGRARGRAENCAVGRGLFPPEGARPQSCPCPGLHLVRVAWGGRKQAAQSWTWGGAAGRPWSETSALGSARSAAQNHLLEATVSIPVTGQPLPTSHRLTRQTHGHSRSRRPRGVSLHGRGPAGSPPEGQGPGEPAVSTEIAAVVTTYGEPHSGVSERVCRSGRDITGKEQSR